MPIELFSTEWGGIEGGRKLLFPKIPIFPQLRAISAVYYTNTMNHDEQSDPVWNLLATRQQPAVRPDFTSSVMAAIQSVAQDPAETSPGKIVAFPARRKLWPVLSIASVAAVAALGLFLNFTPSVDPTSVAAGDSPAVETTVESTQDNTLEQEFTAVQDIHALITVEDPSELNDAQLFALIN